MVICFWSSAGHSPPFGMRYVPLDHGRRRQQCVGLQRHSSTGQVLGMARLLAESYVPLDHNRKDIMRYKSKHNLLRWFLEDHRTLPKAYLKSCEEFFSWLKQCNKEGFKAPSSKLQAASDKLTQRQTKNNK